MKFSLVTTCLNEMQSLPQWRRDLEAQTRFPDEIVVVDAVSKDGTIEFLQKWAHSAPRVKIKVERCNAAQGRNLAIGLAAHEHVVSTDMGVRLDSHWFEEIVRPFEEDPSVEVVAGSYSTDPQSVVSPPARAEYYLNGAGTPRLEPGFIISNRSAAYKKTLWSELGGLPEDLSLYADDSVFGRQIVRAGYRMAFAPHAMVYWAIPRTLKGFWQQQYGYGVGDGEAAIKVPVAFRLYRRRICPRRLVPVLTALRSVLRLRTMRAIVRAIRARDPVACACVPVLLFGAGYSFGKGYLVGDQNGKQRCQACRSRLPHD